MTLFYIFLSLGIILLAGELHTNTFYLLVVGLSSIIAAIFAIFFSNPIIPILAAMILAVIGCMKVYKFLPKAKISDMVIKHIGQTAEVAEIKNNNVRVLYSGSYWNAIIINSENIKVGDNVKIVKFTNSLLTVDKI